jgi:hypothetical protein
MTRHLGCGVGCEPDRDTGLEERETRISMDVRICPFHSDEMAHAKRLGDGSVSYTCGLSRGHPGDAPWSWLVVPEPAEQPGLGELAEGLGLAVELPAALASLGDGWFEYGLVERAYAERQPDGFRLMVDQWGHTAIAKKQYTASAYVARILGNLSRHGEVAYRPGPGTGRWRYNDVISWWSMPPGGPWENRTSWESVIGDSSQPAQDQDLACKGYVPGA